MLVMRKSDESTGSRCCSVLMEDGMYLSDLATFIFLFRAILVRTLAVSGYDK